MAGRVILQQTLTVEERPHVPLSAWHVLHVCVRWWPTFPCLVPAAREVSRRLGARDVSRSHC
eukprot:4069124-Pyramimonas_sp.AAC.1